MDTSGIGGLRYELKGTLHQVVELYLEQGQRVYSETGGMVWMDPQIELDTAAPDSGKGILGALGGALSRAIAGESLFLNFFTAKGGPGRVAFSSSFPGRILDIQLGAGQSLIAQRGSFLCAQDSVQIKMEFTKRLGAGALGGEGFVLQRLTGPGLLFLEIDGEVTHIDLAPGQEIRVDSGHIAAMEETVSYDIHFLGLKNIFLAGEGIALAKLTGPGRVWLQHMTMQGLAGRLIPFLPQKN
jgi:uncharacterized protein (TIGR00266 family)